MNNNLMNIKFKNSNYENYEYNIFAVKKDFDLLN